MTHTLIKIKIFSSCCLKKNNKFNIFLIYCNLILYGGINLTNKNIKLQIWKNNSETALATQGEVNSRFLTVKIEDENGPIDLTGKKVYFFAKKPDDNIIFVEMTVEDAENGTAVLSLTSQMSAVSGFLSGCEIHVMSASGNTLIVKEINILVQPSLGICIEESLSELSAFQQMTTDVNTLKQHIVNENNPHNVTAAQIGVPSKLTDLTGTLPVNQGGTGAETANDAQENLGLMKRYTNLNHLSLPANYEIADIFPAMANNTYIELDISTINTALFPQTQGMAKFFKISTNRAYVEYKCTYHIGKGSWVGYYHSNSGFSGWKKIYTENDTVPIANGGTGATTAAAALTALGAAPSNHEHSTSDITSGVLPIENGGTGATTADTALANLGAIPLRQTINDVALDTIKSDGIYELRYTTFENMNVPDGIQTSAAFPAKLLLIVADINATYYQIIFSDWGCYIRKWNQGGSVDIWKQFGGSNVAPLPLTNGGTGATTASAARTALGAQASTDNSLLTNSKTIVGAINELYSMINN